MIALDPLLIGDLTWGDVLIVLLMRLLQIDLDRRIQLHLHRFMRQRRYETHRVRIAPALP